MRARGRQLLTGRPNDAVAAHWARALAPAAPPPNQGTPTQTATIVGEVTDFEGGPHCGHTHVISGAEVAHAFGMKSTLLPCLFAMVLACEPEPAGSCDDVSSCRAPFAAVDPPAFALGSSPEGAVSEAAIKNVGTGVLRIREIRLVVEPAEGAVLDFAGASLEPAVWMRVDGMRFEVMPGASLRLRLTKLIDEPITGQVTLGTNDLDTPEITIPIGSPETTQP